MEIKQQREGNVLTVLLGGRLDTTTSPELEGFFKTALSDVFELVLDLEKLDYISSAGLRVLLSTQKIMNKQGKMKLKNVKETVRDIFEVTGFDAILTIE